MVWDDFLIFVPGPDDLKRAYVGMNRVQINKDYSSFELCLASASLS